MAAPSLAPHGFAMNEISSRIYRKIPSGYVWPPIGRRAEWVVVSVDATPTFG
jgi:hypothetical protein